jgi:hypothetical protein
MNAGNMPKLSCEAPVTDAPPAFHVAGTASSSVLTIATALKSNDHG